MKTTFPARKNRHCSLWQSMRRLKMKSGKKPINPNHAAASNCQSHTHTLAQQVWRREPNVLIRAKHPHWFGRVFLIIGHQPHNTTANTSMCQKTFFYLFSLFGPRFISRLTGFSLQSNNLGKKKSLSFFHFSWQPVEKDWCELLSLLLLFLFISFSGPHAHDLLICLHEAN